MKKEMAQEREKEKKENSEVKKSHLGNKRRVWQQAHYYTAESSYMDLKVMTIFLSERLSLFPLEEKKMIQWHNKTKGGKDTQKGMLFGNGKIQNTNILFIGTSFFRMVNANLRNNGIFIDCDASIACHWVPMNATGHWPLIVIVVVYLYFNFVFHFRIFFISF